MSSLARFLGTAPERRPSQQSVELVQAVRDGAVVAATRIETLAYVAGLGLTNVERVSALESVLANRSPHAADRLAAIADGYAVTVTQTIYNLGGRSI